MNLKQTDFADRLGIHKSTVSKYEKGIRKIPMEDIGKMADVLGISIEDLLLEKHTITEVPVKQIPVVSKVSAGMPIYSEQNIVDYIYLPADEVRPGKEVFGLIVSGDSMNKEFKENDIVIIEKDSIVENGEMGVVMVNGYNATLKQIKYVNDSIVLMPQSDNPEHDPQIYNNQDEVCIIGKVIGMHRKF
ncbi:LexA family protein [Salinicoccus halodurans]|nr:LexA family transcriptional regulator [Salinicoccus halodurans]